MPVIKNGVDESKSNRPQCGQAIQKRAYRNLFAWEIPISFQYGKKQNRISEYSRQSAILSINEIRHQLDAPFTGCFARDHHFRREYPSHFGERFLSENKSGARIFSFTSGKGGRPSKSLAEKRKYRLSLKLNTSEYLQLKSKSKIAGKNRCDFLRELIFSSEIKQQFSKEQNEIFRQITGIANNLNQLVKLAHVQSVWYIEITAKKLLDDLDELLKRIKL